MKKFNNYNNKISIVVIKVFTNVYRLSIVKIWEKTQFKRASWDWISQPNVSVVGH